MTPSELLIQAIQRQSRAPARIAQGCYGRLTRTLQPTPQFLADEQDRRVVMVMGPSSLAAMLGKSPYDMIVEVGHTPAYIACKIAQGYSFHLVVFQKPEGAFKLATWKNCVEIIARAYPEASVMIKAAAKELKTTDFALFEKQAGFSFAAVDQAGTGDERFMTLERLLAGDGSALAVRRFLYHVTRLTELYTGDGYTLTHDGKRGVREYIMENHRIDELKGVTSLALDVTLPPGH